MLRSVPVAALLAALIVPSPASAQEFKCSVSVSYSTLTGSDYSYLDELKERASEYVNQQTWTTDRFEENERIECTMQIVITEAVTTTSFRGRIIAAVRRPIYGTTQQTTVVQLSDDAWAFEYSAGTPLVFDPDRFQALTSVLDFYAYLLLGFDYDTFSPLGGSPYFERARRIAEIAASTGSVGWTSIGGDRSRTELISQILDQRFRDLREAYFEYHFGCLDRFVSHTDQAREVMLEVVKTVRGLYDGVSRSYFMDAFFQAKYQELAAVFRSSQQASQAFDLLAEVDPAHISEYNQMMQ